MRTVAWTETKKNISRNTFDMLLYILWGQYHFLRYVIELLTLNIEYLDCSSRDWQQESNYLLNFLKWWLVEGLQVDFRPRFCSFYSGWSTQLLKNWQVLVAKAIYLSTFGFITSSNFSSFENYSWSTSGLEKISNSWGNCSVKQLLNSCLEVTVICCLMFLMILGQFFLPVSHLSGN